MHNNQIVSPIEHWEHKHNLLRVRIKEHISSMSTDASGSVLI
jgi:hypothetical protein